MIKEAYKAGQESALEKIAVSVEWLRKRAFNGAKSRIAKAEKAVDLPSLFQGERGVKAARDYYPLRKGGKLSDLSANDRANLKMYYSAFNRSVPKTLGKQVTEGDGFRVYKM